MKTFAIFAAVWVFVSSAHAQNREAASPQRGTLTEARRIATAVLSGDASPVLAKSDPKLVTEMGGEAQLRAFITNVPVEAGKEIALDHERLRLGSRGMAYSRIAKMAKGAAIRVTLIFNPVTGLLTRLLVQPARGKGTHVPPRLAKTRLTLPFGIPRLGHVWALSDGGSQVLDNYHARLDTYYAIDVSPRALNNYTQPSLPADAPCWDLPIKAAAPGVVAIARDGLADHIRSGANSNEKGGPGNHVILDHQNGEFTLYAHLRQGSVTLKPGQAVSRGQELGRCGNSGASSAPHLHFQLMDGPDLNTARGIPPIFYDYFAPLQYVERGSLKGGDVVLPGPPLAVIPEASRR
jgi:hypothetical protein